MHRFRFAVVGEIVVDYTGPHDPGSEEAQDEAHALAMELLNQGSLSVGPVRLYVEPEDVTPNDEGE